MRHWFKKAERKESEEKRKRGRIIFGTKHFVYNIYEIKNYFECSKKKEIKKY